MRRVSLTVVIGLVISIAASAFVGSAFAATGDVVEYPVGTTGAPFDIVAGPDGALWYTAGGLTGAAIGRMTTDGTVTEFPLTTGSRPDGITLGPDGNIWFAELGSLTPLVSSKVARITTAGVVTEFPVAAGVAAHKIAAGPDGRLWYTGGSNIGAMTTSGVSTDYGFPGGGGSLTSGITAGPDGNLWFTYFGAGGHGVGSITTGGTITTYPVAPGRAPSAIVTGPDGRLWFGELGAAFIGAITTAGFISEYAVPTASPITQGITTGCDGNVWFTEFVGSKVGQVVPTTGVVTEFSGSITGPGLHGITPGPDGNLWIAETNANLIAAFSPGDCGHTRGPASLADAKVVPNGVNFGSTRVGTTSSRLVRLMNGSSSPMSIGPLTAAAPFGIGGAGSCGVTIAGGADCTIELTFTPVAAGPVSGNATVSLSVGPINVSLDGRGR